MSRGPATIKQHILQNYDVGARIPTEGELSEMLGTSRYAASRALTELHAEGLVERKRRSGTFRASKDLISPSAVAGATMIAFMADEYETFISSELMRGIESRCREVGLNVSLLNSDYKPELEETYLRSLKTSGYAGAIIRIGEHHENIEILDRLVTDDYPIVLVDRRDDEARFPCVKMAQKKATYDATRYLLEQGHERIAYIGYNNKIQTPFREMREREEGYRCALRDAGIKVREEYIEGGPVFELGERPTMSYYDALGYEPMNRLLLLKERPTAVLTLHYFFTIGAFRAISDHRLAVPDDVSLMCIDDEPMARYAPVPLTVVAQPLREMGGRAVDMLQEVMNGHDHFEQDQLLEGKIIVRESTRAL